MGIDESIADQYFEAHKNDNLVGRVGTVDDISAAIAYLASEPFVSGVTLVVDGGLCCVGAPRKSRKHSHQFLVERPKCCDASFTFQKM